MAAVDLDDRKFGVLDTTLAGYADELRQCGDATAAVTLDYTRSLHKSWRTVLRMLPVAPGGFVLDLGTGLGIVAFELAANLALDVSGIDIEAGFVNHANALLNRLGALGLFSPGSTIRFSQGDIRATGFPERMFDLVFVREVLQFVPDPVEAVAEVFRVLRPGGYFCVSDTDDQLRITWPPASAVLEGLVTAVAAVQHKRGGDREAGRKLTTYLRAGGFEIAGVVVLPEAQHRVVDVHDAERSLIIEQLHAARTRVVEAGAMDAHRFDADLAALEREPPFEEFRLNAKIVVLGRRPADPAGTKNPNSG
jgi:ubiquinone/menaquinone biosynthesis C-methylase UbiE